MMPVSQANLGVALLDKLESIAARSRVLLGHKRQRAAEWAKSRGLGWSAPPAGLFGLLWGLDPKGLEERVEQGLRDHGVLAVPGHFFGVHDGVRLAWSCSEANFEEGLRRLERVI
jgi:aspartate/methionine/tyrosine aminotransferase